jgi:uncharacterized protein
MDIQRIVAKAVKFYSKKYPIIALTGPRQSGKTTLLKTMFPKYEYVTLEDIDTRNFLATDARGFFKRYNKHIIFDEAQRVPDLFSYIQTIVDNSGMMGQFILSGSQNFHLMESITQSLAGRVGIFKLFPFDFDELKSANLLSNDFGVNLIKGFYPAIYTRDIIPRVYYENYINTYIERDTSQLINLRDARTFRNFLALCATRAGQILNLNALARECGISQPTAKSWLSVLENSYIVYQLSPYFRNYSKRIIKSTKLYFYDTGLLCHLLKIRLAKDLSTETIKGALFENMIIMEKLKQTYHKNLLQDFWYWRDSEGNEIDLITQNTRKLDIFEIKCSATILSKSFKGLEYFNKLDKENIRSKNLIFTGDENEKRTGYNIFSWKNI